MTKTNPFWHEKTLDEMSQEEWESLCDGCGKCCVIKLEDVDDGTIYQTDVACRLLDSATCRCTNYACRKKFVPDCVALTPQNLDQLPWMPYDCAYRRLNEGRGLASWHPLITGDPNSTHAANMSVQNKVFCEDNIDENDYPHHIKDWDNLQHTNAKGKKHE